MQPPAGIPEGVGQGPPLSDDGAPWESLEQTMLAAKRADVDWRRGRAAVYIHFAGDDVLDVARRAHALFYAENALGRDAFPSLQRFERELIAMSVELLGGGPETRGTVTTGGTESIFLAVKSARDWARATKPAIDRPLILLPRSAHPAFDKAAHYLGMATLRAPLGADFRADPEALAALAPPETVMLVGSAPAFPHGVVDPIEDLGRLALARGWWLHVDACVGGYIAPFARELGEPIAAFDLSVPGVASLSADLHKYGFAGKGVSMLLYADSHRHAFQAFDFFDWPRGRYHTQQFGGTRPGGAIAAAWAVMRYLGRNGYLDRTRRILATRAAIGRGVGKLGLEVHGEPRLSILAYGATDLDIFAVAERLAARGWLVGRNTDPPAIHLMLTIAHEPIVNEYLADVAACVADVRASGIRATDRTVAYGG